MTRLGLVVSALLVLGSLSALAQNVMSSKSMRDFPETTVIRASMPDDARICVEPKDGGLVACRSVRDLRVWIVQRAK